MRLPEGATARRVDTGTADLHLVEAGPADAPPLLLLHGWPEFWGGWVRLIPQLARRFRLIVPDLRGFGDSAGGQIAPDLAAHVADQIGLLDALGIDRVGIVSHDVGAYVAQGMALEAPDRVSGLFFGNCPYPGIGKRWIEDGHVSEIWYHAFNQQPWSAGLIRQSRETCRLYLAHFLSHWAADPTTFDPVLEDWVDVFMKPGVIEGGFNWYKSTKPARIAQMTEGAQPRAPITTPTHVYWGRHDPVLRVDWIAGLEDYFTDLTVEIAEDAGHFVFFEQPGASALRINRFFAA